MSPRHLTIHCSATPEGRDDSADKIAAMDVTRFGQESYHWIVTLDGKAHRRLADDVRGAHVAGHNTGNIGVCYVGGMTADMKAAKDTRTPAQKRALRETVNAYRLLYPGIIVLGHRDWPNVAKACPCFDAKCEFGAAT